MTKNFPKLMLDTSPQMQEAYRTSSKTNAKKLHLGISYTSCRKSNIKKNNLERSQKEITPYPKGSKDKHYI